MNFDGSMIESKSGSGWVIRDSNSIIMLSAFRYLAKTSIIVAERMTLRDGILAAKNIGFLSLKIKGDSKIVIDSYNKRISVPCSIKILMENI